MELKVINDVGCYNSHPMPQRGYAKALSVAGSDSSAGAGIQADLKTFSALGVYGATAITAVTAQNTQGVFAIEALSPKIVYDQIVRVAEDLDPAAIKIGMLANAEVAEAVADALALISRPIILDPVMVSSSGHRLLSVEAQEVVVRRLLPISELVTPNIPEMAALTGMPLRSEDEKLLAAKSLIDLGARAVLLKGGHEEGNFKTDLLYRPSCGGVESLSFTMPTVNTKNVHGTGCTLSAAIAAFRALGYPLAEALREAKSYIAQAIAAGADVVVGHGHGPVNHLFNPRKLESYVKQEL